MNLSAPSLLGNSKKRYNGLQLCGHINGSYPVSDGSLEEWQAMVQDLKPMRLMWWMNPTYWYAPRLSVANACV